MSMASLVSQSASVLYLLISVTMLVGEMGASEELSCELHAILMLRPTSFFLILLAKVWPLQLMTSTSAHGSGLVSFMPSIFSKWLLHFGSATPPLTDTVTNMLNNS